MINNQ